MHSRGIVRRIDELGRIVIPKELRKTMRLKEGDEMEITSNGEFLTLRKYSGFEAVSSAGKTICKLLVESTGADVLLVDTNSVTVAEGKNKKVLSGARLSDKFVDIVRSRKTAVLHGEDVQDLIENYDCTCCFVVVEPIIVGGDLIGCIVLLLDTMPSDIARAYLHFSAEMLSSILS